MAEYLTTALVVRRDRALWTTLRPRKGAADVVEQADAPLDLPAEVTSLNDPVALAAIKARCGRLKGRVTVGVATRNVLVRIVQLPSTDPAELRGMAELQVDKIAPFPMDQVVMSTEVLAQQDGSTRLLIAIVQRAAIELAGELCFKANLYPHAMDLQVMGWWWQLQAGGQVPATGRHLLLILEGETADAVVVQDGSPIIIRSLGASDLTRPDQAAGEWADEIAYTLAAVELEWGAAPLEGLTVWHAPEYADCLPHLAALYGPEFRTRPLTELPALTEGLARRAMQRTPAMLDLAPADWKETMSARKSRRLQIAIGALLLVIWIGAIAAVMTLSYLDDNRLLDLKRQVTTKGGAARMVEDIRSQTLSLQQYADRSHSALECLREVSAGLPAGIDLSSFRYEKFQSVTMAGYAPAYEPIGQLQNNLNASKLFKGIENAEVKAERSPAGERQRFALTARLPPAEGDVAKKGTP